jgi:hypothetical protein
VKEIPVRGGHIAIVDDEDFELVSKYNWGALKARGSKTIYARAGMSGLILMHRLVMHVNQKEEEVCHVDGNGLHNWKSNLVVGSHAINGELSRRTHCIRGHEFIESNIHYAVNGSRHCKACTRLRDRERWHRRKKEK